MLCWMLCWMLCEHLFFDAHMWPPPRRRHAYAEPCPDCSDLSCDLLKVDLDDASVDMFVPALPQKLQNCNVRASGVLAPQLANIRQGALVAICLRGRRGNRGLE